MADTKITALTALTAADPANDVIPIVDVSDTSMAASGTTKKISVNNILGASGTATLASATITGDLTVRTTGLTVNSSGVGVGTSSQSSFLGNSPKKLVIGDGTQTPALTLYGGAANTSGIYFADGTVGNQAYRGFIEYDHATDAFNLGTGGTSAITVNSSRNLAFPSGKGIDFSAVTGGTGTATANVLNDYEEGTFTPTVGGSTGNGTAVYTKQIGLYTKIGRIVQIQIFVEWNTGTATGNQTVTGLPFTSNSTADNYSILNTYPINIALTALSIATSSIPPSTTIVNIYQLPTGGGSDSNVPCDAAGAFLLTGTYTV